MTAPITIACSTGGFKGVFLQGVLSVFEEVGFRADAYAAASSSVLPAAAAATGQVSWLGLEYWREGLRILQKPGTGMSGMVQAGITLTSPQLSRLLFRPGNPRFLVAANAVNSHGAEETQTQRARRRGRLLLLAAARGDRSWVDAHLTLELFDTAADDPQLRLTADNFEQVTYASSRMLHAWDVPAWVNEQPYVDAFYTCTCPAVQMADKGYEVIAVGTEPVMYTDIFQDALIPKRWNDMHIHFVKPEYDPADEGVDYTGATDDGLATVFQHGRQQGQRFFSQFMG